MTRYPTFDVVTDTPFGGNPLAVIPDAGALPEDALQRIAAEFNYSETTFVYPHADPAHTARIRTFTPTMEVPFAGHPTIGTAVALARLGHGPEMVLELGVGSIRAHATPSEARFATTAGLQTLAHPSVDEVAAALSLPPERIATATHAPVMATLDNIPEDPATGSAAATLAAVLARISGCDQAFTNIQGEDMGRPSRIAVRTEKQAVTVAGAACRVMQGELLI